MKGRKWNISWPKFFAFAAFIFLLYTIYDNWQEHQTFIDEAKSNPVEEKVSRKFVILDLLEGPRYSVQIGVMPKSSIPNDHNSSMVGVDREVFNQVAVGEEIPGYRVDGKFYTESHLNEEERWLYILMVIASLYPVGYILFWLLKINRVRSAFSQISKLLRFSLIGNVLFYLILFGGLLGLIFLFLSTYTKSTIENGYEKFFGDNHAEANAIILDRGEDLNWTRYGGNQNEYYLSLMYKPENAESVFIVKGVTLHTYNMYEEEIPIVYNTDNPYQVFIRDMDFMDFINILMTETVYITLISIILLLLLSTIPYFLWKKNKTGHY